MLVEHPITKPWTLIWLWPPFAAITACTLLGRFFAWFWNVAVGIFAHLGTKALACCLISDKKACSCCLSSFHRCLLRSNGSPGEGKFKCYGIQRYSSQLCASTFMTTVWERLTYGLNIKYCTGQVNFFGWAEWRTSNLKMSLTKY